MSFSYRYLISLFTSVIRAALNLFVSIKVANFLMPEMYGQYQYVLSVITAILLFINFGSENAFFTIISEKKQNLKFYITYFLWQLMQLAIVLLFIIFLSEDLKELIFADIDNALLIFSIFALFFLGNVQKSIASILESLRKTYISQSLILFISIIHVLIILGLIHIEALNPIVLFQVILFEYISYALLFLLILKFYKFDLLSDDKFNLKKTIKRFYQYCKPLVILAFAALAYTVVDRWLIQTYIGASGQAYFAISLQFSTISILLASSISTIFRKEISESILENNWEKVRLFYREVSKNIFVLSSMSCSVLFIYSSDVLNFFYGEAYKDAHLIFKLMMLLPITQAIGTIHVSFLYASSQTKIQSYISYAIIPLSIFLSIFFITDYGLGMGIEGIGIKLLITDTAYILLLEYFICRYLGINVEFLSKFMIFVIFLTSAYFIYITLYYFNLSFLLQVLIVTMFYILPISAYCFKKSRMRLDKI